MAELNITNLDEFKQAYKNCRSTLLDTYYAHVKLTPNLKRINDNLHQIVSTSIQTNDVELEQDAVINADTYQYYVVHEFLILVLYSAYYKVLGIDSDRLVERNFGFTGCTDSLTSLILINSGKKEVDAVTDIMNALLSVGREESYSDYITNNHYCDDLVNVLDLLDIKQRRIGASTNELKGLIVKNFGQNIDSSLKIIKERYNYILEGTFGVDTYKGVYTGRSPAVMQGVSRGGLKVIEPDIDFVNNYKLIFDEILDVDIFNGSSDDDNARKARTNGRQFDIEAIAEAYSGHSNHMEVKPLYFPFKILEFISKCGVVEKDSKTQQITGYTFTNATQMLNYNKIPANKVGSMFNYINHLAKYFSTEIEDYIYRCILIYCKTNFSERYPVLADKLKVDSSMDRATKAKKRDELKASQEQVLIDILEEQIKDLVVKNGETLGYFTLREYVVGSLTYFVDCVTTAVVLDRCEIETEENYGVKTDKILDFRIKICARLKDKYRNYTNQQFVNEIIKAKMLNSSDMPNIPSTSAKVDEQNFTMIDVKYTFNADKVGARPTFAYKALDALISQQSDEEKEKGISPISWSNVLLGRDESGKLFTSGVHGTVNFQENIIHWIYAGSRSGKGVMCYNIFSTAISAGIPIFYMDRKPDTATVLSEICPNMFCVNGGQFDADIDTKGIFNPKSYNFKIPAYLKTFFDDSTTRFDFVYLRSMLLVLTMIMHAEIYPASPMGKEILAGCSAGVVVVLDEFTNFFKDAIGVSGKFSNGKNGVFSNCYSIQGAINRLKSIKDGVKKAQIKVATTENKKNVSDAEISMAHESLAIANTEEFDLSRLYWSAMGDCIASLVSAYDSKKNASANLMKSMNIFIIGQGFEGFEKPIACGEQMYTAVTGASNENKYYASSDANPLLYLFTHLGTDIFAGYQKDRGSYLAQDKDTYRTKGLLNASNRYFAYQSFSSGFKEEVLNELTNTVKAFGDNSSKISAYLNGWKYFKPFLILNNAVELPKASDPSVDYTSKDLDPEQTQRESIRKGKSEDPRFVADAAALKEAQYVGQCLTTCEGAGLTWNDLLSDNDDGTGHLDQRIGFQGYIQALAGQGNSNFVEKMGVSGDLVTKFIHEVYGYEGTWKDFVCDFRPEWMISINGYDEDGIRNDVVKRFSGTFFNKGFLALHPEEVLGNKLESLLDYYSSVSASVNAGLDEELYGVDDEDDEFAPPTHESTSSDYTETPIQQTVNNSVQQQVSEPVHDDEPKSEASSYWDMVDSQTTKSPSSSPVVEETSNDYDESEDDSWSDEDRRHVAELMVNSYLSALEATNTDMYNHFSVPALRGTLNDLMYSLILEAGY